MTTTPQNKKSRLDEQKRIMSELKSHQSCTHHHNHICAMKKYILNWWWKYVLYNFDHTQCCLIIVNLRPFSTPLFTSMNANSTKDSECKLQQFYIDWTVLYLSLFFVIIISCCFFWFSWGRRRHQIVKLVRFPQHNFNLKHQEKRKR